MTRREELAERNTQPIADALDGVHRKLTAAVSRVGQRGAGEVRQLRRLIQRQAALLQQLCQSGVSVHFRTSQHLADNLEAMAPLALCGFLRDVMLRRQLTVVAEAW